MVALAFPRVSPPLFQDGALQSAAACTAELQEDFTELAVVVEVVDRYCSRRVSSTDDNIELGELLRIKRALINRLELDFARDAARFAETFDPDVRCDPSPVAWMRDECHMTSFAASSAICIGQLADTIPLSLATMTRGDIGVAHLGLMASTAQAINSSPTATARFDERRLLRAAERLSVQRFRTMCRHLRHAADRAAFLAEQVSNREWRTLELKPIEGAGLDIAGFLDADGGAALRAALEPLARRDGIDDQRPRPVRYADALVTLCMQSLDNGLIPQRASQRPHLQVTTTLETLLDLAGAAAGEMENAGTVAGMTVRRYACDATITRVLLNAASAVVDVGRSQRVVHGATRTALNVRDKGCVWPGCDRTASWTAAHHLVHWTDGGPTDLSNLVLLCHRHHWCVHEGGWQLLRSSEDGAIATIPPPPLDPPQEWPLW